jgi:metal-responsive CopG/Arc/MetJ family transcriptional regulator
LYTCLRNLGEPLPSTDPIRILYSLPMAARSVQISIDSDLLDQIDADPETRERGRSAFIRSAVQHYLKAKERRETEARLAQAYSGEAADAVLEEVEALIGKQSWPNE